MFLPTSFVDVDSYRVAYLGVSILWTYPFVGSSGRDGGDQCVHITQASSVD